MESNSTAFLIKVKLRHSLGRPSRSDFVQSEVVEVPMSRKVRLCAIIVFIIALIISIIRILIDFNYGIERISPLIPVLDIASAIVWVICIVVNCVLYQKKDR